MLAYLAELFPTRFRGLRNRLPVEHGLHRGHGSPTHRAILAQAKPRDWLLGNAHRWFVIAIVGTAITRDNTGIELRRLDEVS